MPPIEEQRRIAAILDHADGLVAKSQAGRAMLRSLPTSVFNEIPDLSAAPLVPLSELCRSPDDIKCGPFGTQLNRSEFRDHGVPLWGIKQVNKGFSIATREFVSHETATRLASYGIDPGDIVMTRKGTVGNCAVYPKGWPPGIMHSDLLRIRLDGLRALPEFLSHQLHHSQEVAGQLAKQNSGAVMPGLNVTRLKSLEVRVPSLAVQRTFVGELNAIHALASVWEERGRVLVAAVNTLQARAFSGRL
ncbi:MAG: restriction endonuclease subunit S [Dermatophilaceae bacterium]